MRHRQFFFVIAVLFLGLSYGTPAQAYTIDDYLRVLDQNRVSTLDAAVGLLPKEIRSHFTLMYQGHGIRGTSALEPSVIAFDPKGSFFVNVGSPNQALGDQIEILQFDKEKRVLELYSLDFPLKRNAHGKIVRPEKNPARCLSCHGSDPKVLWGNYDHWEGTYANGMRDAFRDQDLANYRTFRNGNAKAEPYRNFIFDPKNEISPYLEHDAAIRLYNETGDPLQLDYRPNTFLGFLTTRVNALSFAREFMAATRFSENGYAVFYSVACDSKSKILKDSKLSQIGMNISDGYQAKTYGNYSLIRYLLLKELQKTDEPLRYLGHGEFWLGSDYGRVEPNANVKALDRLGVYFTYDETVCEYLKSRI